AAGAADGEAEEALAERVELLVDHVHPERDLVLLLVICGPEDEEAGSRELATALLGSAVWEKITGDLLLRETVERQVGIEGLDDVVAVAPRVLEKQRAPAAARLGEARDVEPMAAPALPEMRG